MTKGGFLFNGYCLPFLQVFTPLATREAIGVFRAATECGCGPTKGSESPLATEVRGVSLLLVPYRADGEAEIAELIRTGAEMTLNAAHYQTAIRI